MELMGFLILFPVFVAALLMVIRHELARKVLVCASAGVIGIVSIVFVGLNLGTSGQYFEFESEVVSYVCFAIDCLVGITVLCYAVKYRNIISALLAVVMLVLAAVFEFLVMPGVSCERGMYFDSLSLVMVLIIGVIGSGIIVYALGYMKDHYDHNPSQADRSHTFFALMFVFLGAMYAIVFCNNLTWLLTAWEVTTLCSFLLIGFTKTQESIVNSFRQIIMNMIGGIAFQVALFYLVINYQMIDFAEFIVYGTYAPALFVFPLTCLTLAGMTKAAQMPFHTWLLGAMVAPTPTSALLHSSTMVKAGVFLLLKCAPIYAVSFAPSILIILVGGITFLLTSLMAISQTNAKRVLAYSTIGNLGLICVCAGVGTTEAMWAAVFLIIFHAVAKSLLFLCVGTAEHHISSRDIEDMDLLFERMPKLARLMLIGIMIMFIAPFGMLLAKWATLVSFVDTRQFLLLLLLAYGSAGTFMYYAKWMGKLTGIAAEPANVEHDVHRSEWLPLFAMAAIAVGCCVLMPVISDAFVEPYIVSVAGISIQPISDDNLWLCSLATVAVIAVLLFGLNRKSNKRQVGIYLSGASIDNESRVFNDSKDQPRQATGRNMYMDEYFGESRLKNVGYVCSYLLIVAAFAWAIVSMLGIAPLS